MKISNNKIISKTATGESMDMRFTDAPWLNSLPIDNNKFNRYRKKYCYARLSANVWIPTWAGGTILNFDVFQTNDNRYSKTNGRINVLFPWDYIVQATVAFQPTATWYRNMDVLRNWGTTWENPSQDYTMSIPWSATQPSNILSLTFITYIWPSDYVQIRVSHNASGNRNVLAQYTTLRIYGIQ